MNMKGAILYYRRHLPHCQIDNAYYFITYRLKDSLPQYLINHLKTDYLTEKKIISAAFVGMERKNQLYILQKKYFGKFDYYLDRSLTCVNYLSDERIAKIVCDAMKFLDGKDYTLLSYCVMPNHVHMLIHVERFLKPLYKTMQSIKRHTSRESNKTLNLSGHFWEQESYDHIVRNYQELINIKNYISNDPLKAGIIENLMSWKWKYNNSSITYSPNSFYTHPLHKH
ncbi:MAG: transposase [Ignavibacteria bacterium]